MALFDKLHPGPFLHIPQHRDLHENRMGHVELAGSKRQVRCRDVAYDLIFYPVEIRSVLLPIIDISGQCDAFIGLEFNELKRAGTNRVLPHLPGPNMARIDG